MARNIPQFLIAAPASSSGKTTLCRGLMALLSKEGAKVQPYKCGPDYIDTKFHAAVCGRSSVNLDAFMSSPNHLRWLYAHYAADADVCIAEGMMGVFDGYERDKGSSAEIAVLLDMPVVLVVDASSAAYSLAALLSGFIRFRPEVRVAGVIFNRVGSPHHYALLQEVCGELQLPCFGYLPKDAALEHKSRYLGLDFSDKKTEEDLEHLVRQIESHVDVDYLLQATTQPLAEDTVCTERCTNKRWQIAIARDEESFSFLYTEHLDILKSLGEVTFFSPEADQPVPLATDLLYLPGGYPEKHAQALSKATHAMDSIRCYIEHGGRALAECGGMIYLSKGVYFDEAPTFVPLVGVLPFAVSCRADERKLSLGYRRFAYNGQELRGHEFHYSQIADGGREGEIASLAQVYNARNKPVSSPVFRYKNLIASYVHLYWGETNLQLLFHQEENKP